MSKWIAAPLSLIASAICVGPSLAGDGDPWVIEKVLGDVKVEHKVGSEAARRDLTLAPSDTIRTGKNGRAVLVRGQESIMVSPNTSISVPNASREGMSTIIQRTGTILLEVEKKNVQHFEVETPFLATVVKGTRFEVRVGQDRAKVSVLRGQVQVADFKSGQIGMVTVGQTAMVTPHHPGLTLTGLGPKAPIQQGTPRASRVQTQSRVTAPAGAKPAAPAVKTGITRTGTGGIRITGALGPVQLDVNKATGGMARSEAAPQGSPARATIWNGGQTTTTAAATTSNSHTSVDSTAASSPTTAPAAASTILTSIFGTTSSSAPAAVVSSASAPSTSVTSVSGNPAATTTTSGGDVADTSSAPSSPPVTVSTASGTGTSGSPAASTSSSGGGSGTPATVASSSSSDVGSSVKPSSVASTGSSDTGSSVKPSSVVSSTGGSAGGTGNGNSSNNSSGSNAGGNGNGNSANNSNGSGRGVNYYGGDKGSNAGGNGNGNAYGLFGNNGSHPGKR